MKIKSSSFYREHILDHYHNPRNFGKMKKPTHKVRVTNPLCGDEITLQLKVKKGRIIQVKFQGQGCALSQASASILTEYIKNKNLSQVKKLKPEKILKLLMGGKISPSRINCVLLAYQALKKL